MKKKGAEVMTQELPKGRMIEYWRSLLRSRLTGNWMLDESHFEEVRSALRDAVELLEGVYGGKAACNAKDASGNAADDVGNAAGNAAGNACNAPKPTRFRPE